MDDPDLPRYLLIAALVLAPIAILIWLRERYMSARTRVLREILDHADALESELQGLQGDRDFKTLAAEPEVQAALHDLLQHRLWLKQFGADASLNVLRSACKALEQSRSKLSTQLERLEQVREELASAGSNLETP